MIMIYLISFLFYMLTTGFLYHKISKQNKQLERLKRLEKWASRVNWQLKDTNILSRYNCANVDVFEDQRARALLGWPDAVDY